VTTPDSPIGPEGSGNDHRTKDPAYYDQVRQALGKGSRSLLFGTSDKALDRSVDRLRKARSEADRDALRRDATDNRFFVMVLVSVWLLLAIVYVGFAIYAVISPNAYAVSIIARLVGGAWAVTSLVLIIVRPRIFSDAVKSARSRQSRR
jgi:hypothetical protein